MVPTIHWGQIRPEKTFYKTYNAIEKHLKAKLQQFSAAPTLHRSPIWSKSTFYKTFQANENQLTDKFYKFLQPRSFTWVTYDQEVQFIRF